MNKVKKLKKYDDIFQKFSRYFLTSFNFMGYRKNQPLTLTIKALFYSLTASAYFIAFFSFEHTKFKIKPLLFLNIDVSDRSIFSILVLNLESKMKLKKKFPADRTSNKF